MTDVSRTRGLEITTVFGCSIRCTYCPQDVLLHSHSLVAHQQLQFSDFKLVCDKLPKPFKIHFAGFSEPFHNPRCADMIRYALDQEFLVKISTTLNGFRLKDIDIFEGRRCHPIVLHLPSIDQMMTITMNSQYLESVGRVIQTLRVGDLVLTFGRAFHPSIARLFDTCESEVETRVLVPDSKQWYTRAGNNITFKETPDWTSNAAVRCSKERLTLNVMLPDGTVVLCCMDWSGKHVLGNLFKQSYEDIVSSESLQQVVRGLSNSGSGTLCWKCEFAVPT